VSSSDLTRKSSRACWLRFLSSILPYDRLVNVTATLRFFHRLMGLYPGLVIRNRIGSAWKLGTVTLVTADPQEHDAGARGLLEGVIHSTKRVQEPQFMTNTSKQADSPKAAMSPRDAQRAYNKHTRAKRLHKRSLSDRLFAYDVVEVSSQCSNHECNEESSRATLFDRSNSLHIGVD
jgi:hypothetical protein